MSSALSLEGLRVEAPVGRSTGPEWREVVAGVDLVVPRSTVCGIVGETGAGKTLTMRAAIGLLPAGVRAVGGRVHVGGDAWEAVDWQRGRQLLGRETSVVLQNPAGMFDPIVKVGRQLVEGVVSHGLLDRGSAQERACELLVRAGFTEPEEVMGLYPHELSGGMTQRAAIALALMPKPSLIVADEPTSALDANLRVEVLQLLRETALAEETAVVLISHDLASVSRFADAVAVMYAGRIVESGAIDRVLGNPRHPYSDLLLRTSARLTSSARRKLPVIAGTAPSADQVPSGCVFRPRCPAAVEVCHRTPVLAPVLGREVACHRADSRVSSAQVDRDSER